MILVYKRAETCDPVGGLDALAESRRGRAVEPPPAVVTAVDGLAGLQALRLLSDRGVPTYAIAFDPAHWGSRTRACREIHFAPDDRDGLVELLLELGPKLPQKAVLYPSSDMSVLTIARHREELEPWYHVLQPELEVVEMLSDKVRFAAYAKSQGLEVPVTAVVRSRSDAERAASELAFPCIVKPAIKSAVWWREVGKKVLRTATPADWLAFYGRAAAWTDELVLQEWIEGPESNLYSCNCYFDREGKPVTSFVARKLRQWPPEMGESSLGEEVRNDEVRDLTLRFFENVGYHGLGYLEFKKEAAGERHFVLEANVARPTGRSAIAEAGGVEMLYASYCDALGWPLPRALQQTYRGVKWIHLRGDLNSAFHYMRRGELGVVDWWRSLLGPKAFAVFSWRDPGPFLAQLREILRKRERTGR